MNYTVRQSVISQIKVIICLRLTRSTAESRTPAIESNINSIAIGHKKEITSSISYNSTIDDNWSENSTRNLQFRLLSVTKKLRNESRHNFLSFKYRTYESIRPFEITHYSNVMKK